MKLDYVNEARSGDVFVRSERKRRHEKRRIEAWRAFFISSESGGGGFSTRSSVRFQTMRTPYPSP